jgi:hypothetical protein
MLTPKQRRYLALCEQLSARLDREVWLLEHDQETWFLSREIDTWLTTYMEDDRVGVAQYERVCARLRALYVEPDVGLSEASRG